MPDRILAPGIKNPEEFKIELPDCKSAILVNEVPVLYLDGGPEDVIKIDWVFRAGTYYEAEKGVAAAVCRLLKSGTGTMPAFVINNQLEFYGAFLATSCYTEYAVITLEVMTKHLQKVLPLVKAIFSESVFPDEEIKIYRQNTIQQLKVNLKKSDYVANRHIRAMLYGAGHPYGRSTTETDLQNLTRADLMAFYDRFYRQGICSIFAAGRLPPGFVSLMNDYFGGMNFRKEIEVMRTDRQLAGERVMKINNDAHGVQASIRIARTFPGRKHPDFMPAMVLNALLGGYFGSRLMSNIREDKGYTYGIYSYLQNQLQFSSWIITTEAGVDVAEAAIQEVFKELERLCGEPAGGEEMRLVRNYLIGQQLAALDGPFQIINRWEGLVLNDLPKDFFYAVIHAIKTVTPNELMNLAQRYFKPEEFFTLTVV